MLRAQGHHQFHPFTVVATSEGLVTVLLEDHRMGQFVHQWVSGPG